MTPRRAIGFIAGLIGVCATVDHVDAGIPGPTAEQTFAVNDTVGGDGKWTVTFKVKHKGAAHVCGLIYTTDGWQPTTVITEIAVFDSFDPPTDAPPQQTSELWKAEGVKKKTDGTEYVVFCEDYSAIDTVKKIYNTMGSLAQPARWCNGECPGTNSLPEASDRCCGVRTWRRGVGRTKQSR